MLLRSSVTAIYAAIGLFVGTGPSAGGSTHAEMEYARELAATCQQRGDG